MRNCNNCGRDIDSQTSISRKQGIWTRLTVKFGDEIFRVRGLVCGKCNDELKENAIAAFATS